MADFSLNEDQLQIQKWVHDFAEDVIRPAGHEWDEREEFPYPIVEQAAEIGLYGWEFMLNAMSDQTGLTLPVAIEEIFWGDAGIGMAIMGSALAAAGISGNGTPEQVMEWVPQCYGTAEKIALGRVLRQRARRRQRRVVAAHPGRVRRGQRRVGAQRHQGVDHQRRHRRRARRGRRGRPGTQGPWSGLLRGAPRHEGPDPGSEVQEARHPRVAHRRGRARRRARPRPLPARRQGEARRQAGPGSLGWAHRREAAGDGHVRGHPPVRRRPGARHRPRRLRVLAGVRQGAQGLRPADHHEPGDRLQAGQHGRRDRRRPPARSGVPRGWRATAATRTAKAR